MDDKELTQQTIDLLRTHLPRKNIRNIAIIENVELHFHGFLDSGIPLFKPQLFQYQWS